MGQNTNIQSPLAAGSSINQNGPRPILHGGRFADPNFRGVRNSGSCLFFPPSSRIWSRVNRFGSKRGTRAVSCDSWTTRALPASSSSHTLEKLVVKSLYSGLESKNLVHGVFRFQSHRTTIIFGCNKVLQVLQVLGLVNLVSHLHLIVCIRFKA